MEREIIQMIIEENISWHWNGMTVTYSSPGTAERVFA
jgi:hypothetical protein